MAQLSTKIKLYVGRLVDFTSEVILLDDGTGAVIDEWNIVSPPEPTQAQLDLLDPRATEIDAETAATQAFRLEYGTVGLQRVIEIDSAVNSIQFDYLLAKKYEIRLFNVKPVADGQNLLMKASVDNGSTFLETNTYQWANGFRTSGTANPPVQRSTLANFIGIARATAAGGNNCISNTGDGLSGTIELLNSAKGFPLEVIAKTNYYRTHSNTVNTDNLVLCTATGSTVSAGTTKIRTPQVNSVSLYFQSTGGSQIASGRAELWAS